MSNYYNQKLMLNIVLNTIQSPISNTLLITNCNMKFKWQISYRVRSNFWRLRTLLSPPDSGWRCRPRGTWLQAWPSRWPEIFILFHFNCNLKIIIIESNLQRENTVLLVKNRPYWSYSNLGKMLLYASN